MSTVAEALPFRVGLASGLARLDGLIRLESDDIVFEFETKDGIFGIVSSGVKELRLPASELISVRFRRGFLFWGPRIELSGRSMGTLHAIPGCKSGSLKIKIAKHLRPRAREMATEISLRIQSARIESLDREIQALERMPTVTSTEPRDSENLPPIPNRESISSD